MNDKRKTSIFNTGKQQNMKLCVVVLGAGFGGLELTTILSEKIGDRLDLTHDINHVHYYFLVGCRYAKEFSFVSDMIGRK